MAASKNADKLTAYGKQLNLSVSALKQKPYVKAGIQQSDFSKPKEERESSSSATAETRTEATLGEVAIFNEFGIGVPERSFIRAASDINAQKWYNLGAKLKNKIIDGSMNVTTALGVVGSQMEADIKNRIRTFTTPPNADETIRRKKSSQPLIDTGQLVTSIRYVVVPGKADAEE